MGLDALLLVVYEGMIYVWMDYDLGRTATILGAPMTYPLAAGYESKTKSGPWTLTMTVIWYNEESPPNFELREEVPPGVD